MVLRHPNCLFQSLLLHLLHPKAHLYQRQPQYSKSVSARCLRLPFAPVPPLPAQKPVPCGSKWSRNSTRHLRKRCRYSAGNTANNTVLPPPARPTSTRLPHTLPRTEKLRFALPSFHYPPAFVPGGAGVLCFQCTRCGGICQQRRGKKVSHKCPKLFFNKFLTFLLQNIEIFAPPCYNRRWKKGERI